jgi:hypothetical protein
MKLERLAVVGILLSTVGCMSVRPVPSVAQFVPQQHPLLVWVTYTDNSIVPVMQPKITGDSLVGTWQGLSEPVAIPLGDVKLVQARQPDKVRTRWLVGALTVFTAAGVYALSQATGKAVQCVPSGGQTPDIPCY